MLYKINFLLKILIVIGLIVLALLSVYYKYDDCSICSFEYEGEELSARDFMIAYSSECLVVETGFGNFSIPNSNNT